MQLIHSKMLLHNWLYLVPYSVVIMFSTSGATTACQVYPSEYAYEDGSVSEQESVGANCRRYPDNLQTDVFTNNYIHCDGAKRKLTDSNLGQEQYQITDYYVWLAGSATQLLFIFPTEVSLTTITLHYYSDSVTGLPRLSFYAVPDDFNVWDTPAISNPPADVVSVPPGGEPAGRRSVSITVNFNTKKVLMYVFRRAFMFSVSEVEFFTCRDEVTTASTFTMTNDLNIPTASMRTESNNTTMSTKSIVMEKESTSSTSSTITVTNFKTDELKKEMTPPNSIAIGVSIVILLVLSTILIIIVVAFYKRRSAKQKFYTDCSYSTLSRASGPQTRTRSTQENSSELYDQIHLSPSTGQTEYIPKSENADINNPYTTLQNSHPAYSTVGENTTEHSSTLNATIQETSTQQSLQVAQKSIGEQPTYAAIDKSKKKKFKADEKGPTVSPYAGHEVPSASAQEEKEKVTKEDIPSPHTIEQLYTAVNKKEKVCEPNDEEQAPRIPPHTVEELYTAVQKKPKGRSNADHNIPPHTEEKAYVAKEKPLHTTIKDPCTAAMKNPKDGSTENTDTAPPIPPHTVEELYSAVMKTPKRAVEEEEKAPPKPPCTVEKISGHELNQLVGL